MCFVQHAILKVTWLSKLRIKNDFKIMAVTFLKCNFCNIMQLSLRYLCRPNILFFFPYFLTENDRSCIIHKCIKIKAKMYICIYVALMFFLRFVYRYWSYAAGSRDHFNRGRFSIEAFFQPIFVPFWKLFKYLWLAGKSLDRKPAPIEVMTWTG